MIGHNTWLDVHDQFVTRPLDLLRVVGKSEPVAVYELVAEKLEEVAPERLRAIELYNQGITLYREKKFAEADEFFLKALEADPNDGPSKEYHNRCEMMMAEPPPENWDGVWVMREK